MRASLQRWINDADTARHFRYFRFTQLPIELGRIDHRLDDYYLSLVGELFANLRQADVAPADWAQLGNAFLQFTAEMAPDQLLERGISGEDAALFASASFYFGGFPASAALAMRRSARPTDPASHRAVCYDFLARPETLQSAIARNLQEALTVGALDHISAQVAAMRDYESAALEDGPEAWIVARLMTRLLTRFQQTNLRAVLPEGTHPFWTPLVRSLVHRRPPSWEFFPSQIQAIHGGLLQSADSYALQMPTGAGKTTLCETLLYWHLGSHPQDVAVLLVPLRSLASELKVSLVARLNAMGLRARCAYGGTVPSGEEARGLDQIRAMVATPETLSGILTAEPAFAQRISLVICDEGHLLDGESRGIGLELLLARMKSRAGAPPRFVFVSAIVPNIEEINSWLGGTDQTVIRSTYRPAIAEFAVLQRLGTGTAMTVSLAMHQHESPDRRVTLDGFLNHDSFAFINSSTGNRNTYAYGSLKTQAVAAARKVLPMGTTAIFATNKRGDQGAEGLMRELVNQLAHPLALPAPSDYAQDSLLMPCLAYLEAEYGAEWIGTQAVRHGAVLHHGDIPQESREVLETLIRENGVQLVICTNTLAEGVNLPIRSLVLYSVQRRTAGGQAQAMLARDIKNLVGRAGRAGANTKGLVICANPGQWGLVLPVAQQGAGEPVRGSLVSLVRTLAHELALNGIALSNELLESKEVVYPVLDGVDSTLIDLIAEEVGEDVFVALARELAERTFAARQLEPRQRELLRDVFALRAQRLIHLRATGQLAWVRSAGAKVRMLPSVSNRLWPARANWVDPVDVLDDSLRVTILDWAWSHAELRNAVEQGLRLEDGWADAEKARFFEIVRLWMHGQTFLEISRLVRMDIDNLLAVYTRAIAFTLQMLVEQGLSLLARRLQADGLELAAGVADFAPQLRFGAPNHAARWLAELGVRHRRAYVGLGRAITQHTPIPDLANLKVVALDALRQHPAEWRTYLGELVYTNTIKDLA